jgi:DNA-binding transcriptional LysR family regulator
MDLELRHLKIVCAVAEAGSVTKAAAVLGLAQPAVTAQLRRIERSLGGQLFDRGRQGVTPTPLGELVLTRARVLLPAARELHDEAVRFAVAERLRPGVPTRLRIGSTGGPYLAGMVRYLGETRPETEVVTSASFSALDLMEQVRSDRIDCAVIGCCGEHGLPAASDLDIRTVAVEPVCVMLPEAHPTAGEPEVHLAALSDERWAWLPGDGCLYDCFVAACVREGFTPRTGYETDAATCIELSRTGKAVSLCLPVRRGAGVIVRPIAGAPLRWVQAMVWRAEAVSEAMEDVLLPAAAVAYQELVDDTPAYRDWLANRPTFGLVS